MKPEEIIRATMKIADTGQGDQIHTLLNAPDDDAMWRGTSPVIVAMIGLLLGRLPEVAEAVLGYQDCPYMDLSGWEEGRQAIAVCEATMRDFDGLTLDDTCDECEQRHGEDDPSAAACGYHWKLRGVRDVSAVQRPETEK